MDFQLSPLQHFSRTFLEISTHLLAFIIGLLTLAVIYMYIVPDPE